MPKNPYKSPEHRDPPAKISDSRVQRFNRAYWVLWISGFALIVLAWLDIVRPEVGWLGFGIAMTVTLLSMFNSVFPPR